MPAAFGGHGNNQRAALGDPPSQPLNVTSITKDSGATVSFLAPTSIGSSSITDYVITPYIGASPQSSTTIAVGSLGSITGSDTNTYLQGNVTGLTNSTAYTFTVKARNTYGDSAESAASGANTPLSGLVFGDDFNGPASGPIDPEWWVYNRLGYLSQSEVEGYLPSHCILDGSGNLQLIAEHVSNTWPLYPSAAGYPGNKTQPWTSGACQSNTRTYAPISGNTMTFECRFQVNPNAGNGFWPGMFWLEGQANLNTWKTDPLQGGWNDTDHAEIDVAEWNQTGTPDNYLSNVAISGFETNNQNTGIDLSAAMHVYAAAWKPGVNVKFYRDGTLKYTSSTVPISGCQFFLLLYQQMLSGGPTGTETIFIDYVRVYDQNLG